MSQKGLEVNKNDLAASFQYIAVDEIVRKINIALSKKDYKMLVLAGGVSANKYLREEVKKVTDKYNVELAVPRMLYCTDNAAMIASAGYQMYLKKDFSDYSLKINPSLDL